MTTTACNITSQIFKETQQYAGRFWWGYTRFYGLKQCNVGWNIPATVSNIPIFLATALRLRIQMTSSSCAEKILAKYQTMLDSARITALWIARANPAPMPVIFPSNVRLSHTYKVPVAWISSSNVYKAQVTSPINRKLPV